MSKGRIAPAPQATTPATVKEQGPDPAWLAANIQGRIRGIASALEDISTRSDLTSGNDAGLLEVLIAAPEREADRLEELESALMSGRAVAA